MLITECVSIIKDVVLAIAGGLTAWVAVKGLKTWSRQLRGTANFEVARALSRATYKLRDQIHICRTPFIRNDEFPEWYSSKIGKLQASEKSNAYEHVFAARWASVNELLHELDAQTLEAEALWGAEIRIHSNKLRSSIQKLRAAIEAYISDAGSNGEIFKTDPDFGKKIMSEIFTSNQFQNDEFSNEIEISIKAIENELKLHLKR